MKQEESKKIKESDLYETPPEVFAYLSKVHGPFDLDVCAQSSTAKCDLYMTPHENALIQEWANKSWCNPPYSNPMPWIQKAITEKEKGNTTCMLLPADVSTKWFRLMAANSVYYFWKGRISFLHKGEKTHPAKFGSVVALFLPEIKK